MAGTRDGGLLAAKKNYANHGADFYAKIGAMGGSKTNTATPKGFAANRERARTAGAKGGTISRRGRATTRKTAPLLHPTTYESFLNKFRRK